MKNVIFKGIKALAILFVLYILISLIVPPIFQKEPIELEGAEFAGTGVKNGFCVLTITVKRLSGVFD